MSYTHPEDPNLRNLHKTMEYDASGQPAFRTIGTNMTSTNPGMIAYVDSFASGAVGVGSGQAATTTIERRTNTIYQNYDSTSSQVLAIIATKLANNADVRAGLTWLEIK